MRAIAQPTESGYEIRKSCCNYQMQLQMRKKQREAEAARR
jgi:hypothetical protein